MSRPLRARAVRVRLPLRHVHRASHGTETHRESVLVCVEVDGAEGWGECATLSSPGYLAETTDLAWRRLTAELLPAVVHGGDLEVGASMAAAAVRAAMLDARLRGAGRSLAEQLGVETGARVPCGAVIGRPHDGSGDEIDELLAAGYRRVKVKVGPGDGGLLAGLRDRLSADAPVAVDANGAYSWRNAGHRNELLAFDDLGLLCIEQPLAPDDLAGSAELQAGLATSVALDEPVDRPSAVDRVAEAGAARQVCVKPARLGAEGCVDAAARARALGLQAWVGSMMETAVGRAVAVVTAAAVNGPVGDLAPSERHFADDVAAPLEMGADGCIAVPAGPGASPSPDPEALRRFAVETWESRA